MDCAPVIDEPKKTPVDANDSKFIAKVKSREKVFIMYNGIKKGKPRNVKYFDHPKSKRIFNAIQHYMKNGEKKEDQIIIVDEYTVNI